MNPTQSLAIFSKLNSNDSNATEYVNTLNNNLPVALL